MAEDIPQAARDRVNELAGAEIGVFPLADAFARYIQQADHAARTADAFLAGYTKHATAIVAREELAPFILADTVDPLRSILLEACGMRGISLAAEDDRNPLDELTKAVRRLLSERGIELGQSK